MCRVWAFVFLLHTDSRSSHIESECLLNKLLYTGRTCVLIQFYSKTVCCITKSISIQHIFILNLDT